jgi:DNA recombination protein Rad52
MTKATVRSFDTIKEELEKPLIKEHVKQRDGTGNTKLSYLPSFHVINEANRIFGFGNWDTEILTLKEANRKEYEKEWQGDKKPMVSVAYLCNLRLTVRQGEEVSVHEDTGFGDGTGGNAENTAYGICSAIELASKEAVTDATKRCLRYFGAQFGLSLYDKDGFGVIPFADYEAGKMITDDQLGNMRDLYDPRGIDDEWVIKFLKGEGLKNAVLADLRQDWYEIAYKAVENYKLDEINAGEYEAKVANAIKLMSESVNIRMLKAIMNEAWNCATQQEDKAKQSEIQLLFEELKVKFEPKSK